MADRKPVRMLALPDVSTSRRDTRARMVQGSKQDGHASPLHSDTDRPTAPCNKAAPQDRTILPLPLGPAPGIRLRPAQVGLGWYWSPSHPVDTMRPCAARSCSCVATSAPRTSAAAAKLDTGGCPRPVGMHQFRPAPPDADRGLNGVGSKPYSRASGTPCGTSRTSRAAPQPW